MAKLQTLTDPAGNTLTYTYNEAGELIKETDSAGHSLAYTYNALGQPLTITDSLGRTTTHTYEKGGRLLKTTNPDGSSVSYAYDNKGRVKTKENSGGYALTYTYDCMDRVVRVMSSDGQEKHYAYDVMGNVTAMTDANGNTTAYEYTPAGKLSSVTDALGNRTQYRYDALDNLILIERTGEGGEAQRKTEYIRNPFGQVEAVKDALGREERYTYDAFGRMKEKTDRDGNTTAFSYEPDGKTKSILYADGKSVEMEYDALRRLIRVKDWLGETTIDRDTMGQTEAVTDHTGKRVTYRYGKMGERTGITYPDGKSVTYRYDGQLRLTEMQIPGYGTEDTITYHYDERGRLSEKHFPDGLRTLWHYGKNGELTQLLHEDKDGLLDSYAYEYDPMGNKTAIIKERRGLEEESGRYEYAYDALGRLATVTKDGEALRSYAYDPFGNRSLMQDHKAGITAAYTYDALDRLTQRKETLDTTETIREYRYDNRGNLTEERENGGLLHGYAYNAMNRLGRAWDAEGKEALYEYNGLGQRTGRQTGDTKEAYLLDLTRPYHNLLGMVRGADERTFYWDGNVAAMAESTAADGMTMQRTAADGTGKQSILHYYLQDELGSPLRVSGYDRDYLTYGYDEFGNDLYNDLEEAGIPNPYSRQGEEQPFGYTGYRHDEIGGTYFAQAREYQPQNGRFTAEDVIKGNGAFPETLNRYGYCWGNPILFIDLNGLAPEFTTEGGNEAHKKLQAEFLARYPIIGAVEFEVRGYALSSTGKGKIDILLKSLSGWEVYEIKPHSNRSNLEYRTEAHKQREGYIDALEGMGKKVNYVGKTFNPNGWKIPSDIYSGYDIKYYTYSDDPGMIYYGYVKRNEPEPEPVVVKESEKEFQQVAIGVAEGVTAGVAVYFLYRIARMIPSLLPPLWWTIPANAACP